MNELFYFGKEIIEKANVIILKNLNKASKISYKKGVFNLVTNVDHKVEKFIISKITSKYPEHSIIAEESGTHNKNPRYQWFIDPIDGTTNFAHRYPCFCISLAFAKDSKIEFGFVKNPATDELYTAIKNKGAWLNKEKIYVSKIKQLKQSLLATGFPHDKKTTKLENFKNFSRLTLVTQGVRRDGAAALDLCYVACGKLDGFWESKLSPWDVAAGYLIVQEAGGKITDFSGKTYNIFSNKVVATNGHIHKELLKQLH